MYNLTQSLTLLLLLLFLSALLQLRILPPHSRGSDWNQQSATAAPGQLHAVRGEIVSIKPANNGFLTVTIRPDKQFLEVTVLARRNDLVGHAAGRITGVDVLELLTGDERDDETITAAELNEGDIVSVIYDPRLQNKALEIYLR